MKILIACEFSGRVRQAFRDKGHDAWSCDLRPAEDGSRHHFKCDVRHLLGGSQQWDMLIGHPYCTYNNRAGIRWMYHPEDTHLPAQERRRHPQYPNRMDDFMEGVEFFNFLKGQNIEKIALENSIPHGLAAQHIGKYTQIVQPLMFGDPYTKGIALWLKGLPELKATHSKGDYERIIPEAHYAAPGPERERARSRTYPALANAFAAQWG